MRILMVLEYEFPPDVRVEKEILALTSAGYEVHLACSTRKNLCITDSINKSLIYRKPMSTFIYKSSVGCLRFPFYFSFWRSFIVGIISKGNYDVIHIHDLPLSKLGVEVKRKYKIPLVIDLHENWPALLRNAVHTQTIIGRLVSSDKQWTRYEKEMLHESDLVVSVVEEAADRIASLGIEKEKLCIVSNTVNTEEIPVFKRKRTDNDFVLFYGGGLYRHRGLQIVLDAIKILKDRNSNIKLQIAGSGSYKGVLEKKASELGIASQILFLGQKPFNEMLELIAEADAAIIPHLRNENNDASSPNNLYQYMYLEIPVISSDCISLKRIISETDAGFIYRNDSPDDLASLLKKLDSDRKLLADKGYNGKKAVLSRYNWNSDKERLIEAYSKLDKTGLS